MSPVEEHFVPKQQDNTDPEISALIKALFAEDGATQKTVLNAKQVIALARAKAFAQKFDIQDLNVLCDFLMQLKISEKGRGRKDLVAALQSRRQLADDDLERQRSKLLGSSKSI